MFYSHQKVKIINLAEAQTIIVRRKGTARIYEFRLPDTNFSWILIWILPFIATILFNQTFYHISQHCPVPPRQKSTH
jgi:hypothetical protein